MKKIIAIAMTILTLLTITGCKKNTVEELERNLTQQLIDSKYISGSINGNIKLSLDNMGEQTFNLSGEFQSNTSSGMPNLRLDGKIKLQDIVSLPINITIDDNKMQTSLFGQTHSQDFSEEKKNQLKASVEMLSKEQRNLPRTVKETTMNNNKALEVTFDAAQLNNALASSGYGNTTIQQATLIYTLNENNQITQIDSFIKLTNNQPMEINLSFQSLSIGQPNSSNS